MLIEIANHDFLMVLDIIYETAMKNEQDTQATTDKCKDVTFSRDEINDGKDENSMTWVAVGYKSGKFITTLENCCRLKMNRRVRPMII